MTAVTPAPRRTAKIRFLVRVSRIVSNLPPAILERPSPIIFIPYRNSDNPPIIFNTLKMSIKIPFKSYSLPPIRIKFKSKMYGHGYVKSM
jgi:hypothetical protein